MNIQSLSVCVPAPCANSCMFCVAHMTANDYVNQIEGNKRFTDLYKRDFKKRLLFARDNGCNTMMITSNGEPLLNREFLANLGEWNDNLPTPFRWIELQTSGTKLDDEYLRFLRNTVGVNTISLSLSSMYTEENAAYNRSKARFVTDIVTVCSEIKRYDFNLRLSLNMTDFFNRWTAEQIFARGKELGANQLTFRVLYESGMGLPEDVFVQQHSASFECMERITDYVHSRGRELERLPFGAMKYSVDGMSVVVDQDCMSEAAGDAIKYLILQPDCHLYSKWDDKGSLVF